MKFDVSDVVAVSSLGGPEDAWAKMTPAQLLLDPSFQTALQATPGRAKNFLDSPTVVRFLISMVKFGSPTNSTNEFRNPALPYFAHFVLAGHNQWLNKRLLDVPDLLPELFSIACLKTETREVSQGYFVAIFRRLVSPTNEFFQQNVARIVANYKQWVLPLAYVFSTSNCECLKVWLALECPPAREAQSNTLFALLTNFANQNLHTYDDFRTEAANLRSLFNFLETRDVRFEPRFLNVRLFLPSKTSRKIPPILKAQIKVAFLGFLAASHMISQVGGLAELIGGYRLFTKDPQRIPLVLATLRTLDKLRGTLRPDSYLTPKVVGPLLDLVEAFPDADIVHQGVLGLLQNFSPKTGSLPEGLCRLIADFVHKNCTIESQKPHQISKAFLRAIFRVADCPKLTGDRANVLRQWCVIRDKLTVPFEVTTLRIAEVLSEDSKLEKHLQDFPPTLEDKLSLNLPITLDLGVFGFPEDQPIKPPPPRSRSPSPVRGMSLKGLNESFVIISKNTGCEEMMIELSFTESGEVSPQEISEDEEVRPRPPLMDSYEEISRNLAHKEH